MQCSSINVETHTACKCGCDVDSSNCNSNQVDKHINNIQVDKVLL